MSDDKYLATAGTRVFFSTGQDEPMPPPTNLGVFGRKEAETQISVIWKGGRLVAAGMAILVLGAGVWLAVKLIQERQSVEIRAAGGR